jgi:predicted DNA-binding transcriptional regulator YafY
MDRLRRLGYPVTATSGTAGGYRLGAGASLPPLLLDDDEAVAVAIGLRLAADGAVAGIEEASIGALLKLQQLLPSRLRHRVDTLHTAVAVTTVHRPEQIGVDLLVALAEACRRAERIRFGYRDHHGAETTRSVEPHQVVSAGGRWYLVAWDPDPDDWRSFRIDRIRQYRTTGPHFTPRSPPEGDFARHLSERLGLTMWPLRAVVHVHAPAEAIADRTTGIVEPLDEGTAKLTLAGDSLDALTIPLGLLGADFDILEPDELREHLSGIAARFRSAACPER